MQHFILRSFTFLMTISCGQLFGQTDSTKQLRDEDRAHFILSGGLSYQRQFAGEVGLIYGYTATNGPCNPGGLGGLKFATEFNFNSNTFFIAPKIGAEFDFAFFGARLNIIDYTDFTYHDFKFTPEAGLSFLGIVNLFYGYNFSLTENRIENIGTHRLTLTINLDKIMLGR